KAMRARRGTIELWARLGPEFDGTIEGGGGDQPALFELSTIPSRGAGYIVYFTDNDGAGGGGLVGHAGVTNPDATNTYGGNDYDDVLPGTVHRWHHYALVWDARGLPGVGDGHHTTALFVDG